MVSQMQIKMKKNLSSIFNIIPIFILAIILSNRLPILYRHYKIEGTPLKNYTLTNLDASSIVLPEKNKKNIFIFWATWCGPCSIELNRINKLLLENIITSNNVYAINMGEDIALVRKMIKDKGYIFKTVIDQKGLLARDLKIEATPSIVFINEDQTINWLTSGVSPTLNYRLKKFVH